jgi:ribonuclease R
MTAPPVPRRDAVVDLLAASQRPLHTNEIATRLGVEERSYPALQRLLDDLSFDGSVTALPGQRFRLSKQQSSGRGGVEIEGVLSAHARGFGFVSGGAMEDDVYIPAESMRGALHGDQVRVRVVTRSRRGVEGEVVAIVKRRVARVAGTLRRKGKSAWLEPDDARLRSPIVITGAGSANLGADGEAAVASIVRFPESPDENPEGTIEAVLGPPGDPNTEVRKILAREAVEEEHAPLVVAEAEAYGPEVTPDMLVGREDLTHVPLPTIDPEDARDHDDAVWAVRLPDGSYKAWIAIADVSQYVRPGMALDASSLERACSIYLPDRAIPMLPRALSSNLCSLLPGVVRLCLCVEVDLDATAAVTGYRIVEGFMRSAAKLTYPGVARALGFTGEPERQPEAEAMRDDLLVLWDLARLLRNRRLRRGALDFDLPEAKVVLGEGGAPVDVEKRSHDPGVKKAYQLVEELMLLANETVAQFLTAKRVPTVYRVHGAPDVERLERFATLCGELDVAFDLEDAADPKKLAGFLKKVSGHEKRDVLHMLLLRAMKQAVYDVTNVGHFGLASAAYLHFTSPIRRYPDLVVHRTVKALLRKEHVDASDEAFETLRTAAVTASERERKAMEIEREVVDLYRAIYMKDHIGDVFHGTATALVGTGVFVAVDSPFVDVLVRMESLGAEPYEIDDSGLRLIGQRSGDRIAIGDAMTVQIEDVAILRRQVYARRLPEESDGERPKRGKRESRAQRRTSDAAVKSRATARSGKTGTRPSTAPKGRGGKGKPGPKGKKKGR